MQAVSKPPASRGLRSEADGPGEDDTGTAGLQARIERCPTPAGETPALLQDDAAGSPSGFL